MCSALAFAGDDICFFEITESWRGKSDVPAPFGLPGVTGKCGLLQEAGITPTRGKTIRIARALLVTAGSEGSDRKWAVDSISEPDSAVGVDECAKYRDAWVTVNGIDSSKVQLEITAP